MSLLELFVGILIGLLGIGAAIATLMGSRAATGSVTEISVLQQQASFAMRLLGMQFRQAGALGLIRSSTAVDATYSFKAFAGATGTSASISGADGASGATDTVTAAVQQDETIGATTASIASRAKVLTRDCLSNEINPGDAVESRFYVDADRLMCVVGAGIPQPIIANVTDFQVRYRIETVTGPGTTASQILSAADVTTAGLWRNVNAIEVCLDLQGTDAIPDTGAEYADCTPLSATGTFNTRRLNNRVHLVYRNVFELRKKGPV